MIRKTLILLIASALLASLSCRSIKKSQVQADSTATRSEQVSQVWTRETVTEISLPATDLVPYLSADSSVQFPEIVGPVAVERKGILAKLGFKNKKARSQVKAKPGRTAPALISADARINIKKTERETGQLQSQKREQKQVHTSENGKAKESAGSWLVGISLAAIALLVCLIIIHRSKTRYNG